MNRVELEKFSKAELIVVTLILRSKICCMVLDVLMCSRLCCGSGLCGR